MFRFQDLLPHVHFLLLVMYFLPTLYLLIRLISYSHLGPITSCVLYLLSLPILVHPNCYRPSFRAAFSFLVCLVCLVVNSSLKESVFPVPPPFVVCRHESMVNCGETGPYDIVLTHAARATQDNPWQQDISFSCQVFIQRPRWSNTLCIPDILGVYTISDRAGLDGITYRWRPAPLISVLRSTISNSSRYRPTAEPMDDDHGV